MTIKIGDFEVSFIMRTKGKIKARTCDVCGSKICHVNKSGVCRNCFTAWRHRQTKLSQKA